MSTETHGKRYIPHSQSALYIHDFPVDQNRKDRKAANYDQINSCVFIQKCLSRYYDGRTAQRLSNRIGKHVFHWMILERNKTLTGAIKSHLAESGHRFDPQNASCIVHHVPNNRSKAVRLCTLAISTRLFNHEQFVQTFLLP